MHSLTRLEGTIIHKNHSCCKFLYKLSFLNACLLLEFFLNFLSNPIISSHAICNRFKAIYLKHHNKGEPCGQDVPVHLRVFIGIVTVWGVTEISVPARPQTRNLNSFHNFKSQNFNFLSLVGHLQESSYILVWHCRNTMINQRMYLFWCSTIQTITLLNRNRWIILT